jgi:hypothetical protein
MAHSHAHAHGEGQTTYFLDQLFTILAAGSVGVVAILMYQTGVLSRILVPMFFKPVLIGGVAILAMAVIRAIAVWQLAGARRQAEAEADAALHGHDHGHTHGHSHGLDHAHSHGEDCGHDHSHEGACDHDHSHSRAPAHSHSSGDDDHGHDHGWAPWRYMVIAIPVFLYLLGLPREGFSEKERDRNRALGALTNPNRKAMSLLAGAPAMTKVLRKGEPRELRLGFKELSEAAAMPVRHEAYEGDIGIIRGEFAPIPGTNHEFTLVRWNMTCCRADAIMLETRIVAPEPVRDLDRQWVQVSGVISFQQTEKGKWIPVLTLRSNDDILPTEMTQDANAF